MGILSMQASPAYIIESNEHTWQLVFQIYNNSVTDIFVHKSCCYSRWQTIFMNSAFQILYYSLTPILYFIP